MTATCRSGLVAAAVVLFTASAALSETVTLTPVADASIDYLFGDANLGSQDTLEVGYLSERHNRRALIRFNLAAAVPADAVIDSAQLKLYLQLTDGADPAGFLAVLIAEDWVESQVTWNNQPNRDQPTVGVTMNGALGYQSVDVTDIVRAWHNVPHYGLELRGPEGDPLYRRVFSSRENTETPPQLVVNYHVLVPPTATPTRTPTRTLTPTSTRTPADCIELLMNGDFENGDLSPWQTSGNARLGPGRDSAAGVVLLGANNAVDQVSQNAGIPAAATLARLDFWWLADGGGDQPNDILIAFALHQTGATELKTLHAVAPFGQWNHETLDLTSYAGQLQGIAFTAYSDTAQPSSFMIDDVSLTACGVPTPAPSATPSRTPTPTRTSTRITATPTRSPTPTTTLPPSCEELLANGDFESGEFRPWHADGAVTIGSGYSTPYGAEFGRADNATGELVQSARVPASASPVHLEFWWVAEGATPQETDILTVIVQYDQQADELRVLRAAAPLDTWHPESIDLTAYAGRAIDVTFLVQTDAAEPSTFRVDDVSLKACNVATPSVTASHTTTRTGSPTASPTHTRTSTLTPTPTLTRTAPPTFTPTPTLTRTPTNTPTPSSTNTPAHTETRTHTPAPSHTETPVPPAGICTLQDISPDAGSTPERESSLWGKMLSVSATGVPGVVGPATSWLSYNGDILIEHLAAAEQNGHLMLFYWYVGADWQAVDITEKTGATIAIARPESWLFSETGITVEKLAAPAPDGDLLVFSWHAGSDWEIFNVSEATGHKITGPVTSWVTASGSVNVEHLAARATNDDLLVFYRPEGGSWNAVNVSAITGQKIAGEPAGRKIPWQPGDPEEVAAPGTDGALLLFTYLPSTDWEVVNLTALTGQSVAGPASVWTDPVAKFDKLAAPAPSGDLIVFHRDPIDSAWRVTNVSAATGQRIAGPVAIWITWNGPTFYEHIAAAGPNQHLYAFHKPSGGAWQVVDITNSTGRTIAQRPTAWISQKGQDWIEHVAAPDADGRLYAFLFDPSDDWKVVSVSLKANGRTLFAAAPQAGVWKSQDYGITWSQLTRPQPLPGEDASGTLDVPVVLDVVVSPADPRLVFAATGADHRNPSRTGLYRSTNAGQTWSLVHQFRCGNAVQPVTQVLLAPGAPSTVYAAGGCAIGISTSDGAPDSWTEVAPPGTDGGDRVWHLVVSPQLPGEVRRAFACGDGTLWYSHDSGLHWFEDAGTAGVLPGGFCGASGITGHIPGAQALALDPTNPQRVYLAHPSRANGPSYFVHSANPPDPVDGTHCNDTSANPFRGCGEGSLWYGDLSSFDPNNPGALHGAWSQLPGPPVYWNAGDSGTAFVQTHLTASGYLVFFADKATLHVSAGKPTSDGWHRLDGWDASRSYRENQMRNVSHVHPDPHGLYVSPDFDLTLRPVLHQVSPYDHNREVGQCLGGRIWYSNDGGVYRTDDCGETWIKTYSGLHTLAALNVAVDALPGQPGQLNLAPALYFGTGDNDDFYTLNEGATWRDASGQCADCDAWFSDPGQPGRVLRLMPRRNAFNVFANATGHPDAGSPPTTSVPYETGMAPFAVSWMVAAGYRPIILTLSSESPLANGDYITIREIAQPPPTPARRVLLRARDSFGTASPWTQEKAPGTANVVQAAGGHASPTYYVGDGVRLWRSRRGATGDVEDWDQIVPGGGATVAARFFVNPYDANDVYIVDTNAIRHYRAGDDTWVVDALLDAALNPGGEFSYECPQTDWNIELPAACVINDMVFDREAPQTRFAVGIAGVFYSGDGVNWFRLLDTRAMPSRPRAAWFDRYSIPDHRSLYIALDGRGIMRCHPIPSAPPSPIPTRTFTAPPSVTPSRTYTRTPTRTVVPSVTPTPTSGPPTFTRTVTPTGTRSPSPPTATATRTPSPTPTPSPTSVLPSRQRGFRGTIFLIEPTQGSPGNLTPWPPSRHGKGEPSERASMMGSPLRVGEGPGERFDSPVGVNGRSPQRGVRVALYGSTDSSSLGDLLERAFSGPDGTFGFSLFTEPHTDLPYYFLALDDPNYSVAALTPGSEGEVIGGRWIRFTNPSAGDHGGNRIEVEASGAAPQVIIPDVIPVWNGPKAYIPPGAPIDTGPALDLWVLGIEVTQAIQCFDQSAGYTACPDNSLSLTAGKATAVRVYIGHSGGPITQCTAPGQMFLKQVRVALTWLTPTFGGGVPGFGMWGGPSAVQYVDVPCATALGDGTTTGLRGNAWGAATFIIPNPVGDALVVQANVNGDPPKYKESSYANNTSALVSVPLESRKPYKVKWALIDYQPWKSKNHPQYSGQRLASATVVGAVSGLMRQLYPMAVDYSQGTTIPFVGPDVRDDPDYMVEGVLAFLHQFMSPQPDALFGWLPVGAMDARSGQPVFIGYAQLPGATGIGVDLSGTGVSPGMAETLAHEVGHNRGLGHPNKGYEKCWPFGTNASRRETGFDVALQTTSDPTQVDLMNSSSGSWLSPYTWMRLAGEAYSKKWAKVGPGCAAAAAFGSTAQVSPDMSQPVMVVRGSVYRDGGATIETPFITAGSAAPAGDGAYCLHLQSDSGTVLASHCFDLSFVNIETDVETESASFAAALPFDNEATWLTLWHGTTLLASRRRSIRPPELQVLSVDPGLPGGNALSAGWIGSGGDEDEAPLRYSVLYSPDAGISWTPVAVDIESNSLDLDTNSWPGSEQGQLRVLVSDGFLTSAGDSYLFAVTRKPPAVWITNPEDEAVIQPLDALVLTGHAGDLEDGELSGSTVVWTLDSGRILGNGTQLILPGLSIEPGAHEITLTATDHDGLQSSARIRITVAAPPACTGDCNADGEVTVDELIRGVNIALGNTELSDCPSFDSNGDAQVTIDELVQAVNNALQGCSTA